MGFYIINRYFETVLLVTVVVISRQVFSNCPLNNYYDYHTEQCHPCSDCEYPRTPNQFCLKDCPGQRCEAGKYFDKHTQNCHLCTECKPPLTPNEFCQAQCTDDERNGRTTPSVLPVATTGILPTKAVSVDNIIIIVLCTVMGTVVLVLVILFLYWKKCLCKDKHQLRSQLPQNEQHRAPLIKNGPSNGQHSVNIEMHSLPAPRSDDPGHTIHNNFSLPLQPNQHNSSNICGNNQTNCLRQGEDSVALVDDRDRTASNTPLDSDISNRLQLLETSTRLQYSCSQDKSLKGNVVCHPENEEPERCQFLPSVCQGNRDAGEVHGMLSPSSTRDAEPHLSFDPNKDCGYEDRVFPNSSPMNNDFEIQTSLKSSC